MEPAAADPRVGERPRERQAPGCLRHAAMKGGVEARDLPQTGMAARHRVDAPQGGREVQRRERHRGLQLDEEAGIDSGRTVAVRSAADQPVAGPGELIVERRELGQRTIEGIGSVALDAR